jgi:histidine triad (HIT) family protein
MASVFTKIIRHEIPARIIWEDDVTVAFLDAHPQAYGHTLVVPREEIDEWTDMPTDLSAHLFRVVSSVGKAQRDVFDCARVGVVIQGYGVPHAHVHVFPTRSPADFDDSLAMTTPDPGQMDAAAQRLRAELTGIASFTDPGHDVPLR